MSTDERGRGGRQVSLSEHLLDEIRQLPAQYPQPRSAVMPALDLAQEELGHLTPEAMSQVATALQLDPGYVEGVATFYTLFHLQPIGKHRFYVCTNLSCQLRGSDQIVARLKEALSVREPGEISSDGLFSYEEVECLGACEYAPMCRLDHRYEYDLTPIKIDSLINERRLPRRYQKQVRLDATRPVPTAPSKPAPKPATRRAARPKKSDA
jgi:NADH-quinone oxidoreductase subunit E